MIAHVNGAFKIFDASIYTTGKDFSTAEIDLWIDASSISTGDMKRDEHLKSEEFFDVKHHNQISFTASTLGKTNVDTEYELWGELTIKGITKNVKLMVKFGGIMVDPWGKEKAGFTVSGVINRTEWGLVWNTALESGGFLVGEEVTITCEAELTNEGEDDQIMVLNNEDAKKSIF